MIEHRIPRPQDVDLVFDGDLLADETSRSDGTPRWLETRIYYTESGKYVTEMVGRTVVTGEQDKITVQVWDNAADVRQGFLRTRTRGTHKGEKYLTVQAEDTIREAAALRPDLNAALVERI